MMSMKTRCRPSTNINKIKNRLKHSKLNGNKSKNPALIRVVVKNKKKFKTDKVEKEIMNPLVKMVVMRIISTRIGLLGKWKCVRVQTYLTLETWTKRKIKKTANTLSRYSTM